MWLKNPDIDMLGERLDGCGEDGWELVSVVTVPGEDKPNLGKAIYAAFLKKPKS
jgi:hypothetical protein